MVQARHDAAGLTRTAARPPRRERGRPLRLRLDRLGRHHAAGDADDARRHGSRALRAAGNSYTTVLRGVPELLVIYLVCFGGSAVVTKLAGAMGVQGFLGLPCFLAGPLACGLTNAACQAEVYRGGALALPSYGTELILMTKATSLASIVTLKGTMVLAASIDDETYRAIEVSCVPARSTSRWRAVAPVERRLSPRLRRPPDALPGLDTPLELGTAR